MLVQQILFIAITGILQMSCIDENIFLNPDFILPSSMIATVKTEMKGYARQQIATVKEASKYMSVFEMESCHNFLNENLPVPNFPCQSDLKT
jgi:hypothetical protein